MNEIIIVIALFGGGIYGISRLILLIARKFNANVSAYLLFGIVDILSGLAVLGIAIYDIVTPGGDLNGMLGQILLMIFEPVVIVLLIVDIIVWRKKVKENNITL